MIILQYKKLHDLLKKIIVLLITILFFSACETEVDLVGSDEEKIIVYGIFNIKDSIHYLKINKTFNGHGDAYQMAKIEDSTIIKNIEVVVNNINFDTTTIFTKKPGSFSYPKQILYRNYTTLNLNSATTLNIVIREKNKNKVITAKTDLVDTLKPDEFYGPWPNYNNWIYMKWEEPPQAIVWKKPNNAYFIEIRFLINYIEKDENNNITEHTLPWTIGRTISTSNSTRQQPLMKYISKEMYLTMNKNIPVKPNIKRYFGTKNNPNKHFTVQLLAGNKALYDYIKINSMPTSDYTNQELYQFTNINGGLGMIGSISISEKHHLFSPATADSIITNQHTNKLNFQRPIYP